MLFITVANVFYKLSSDYRNDVYRSAAYKAAANKLAATPNTVVTKSSLIDAGLTKHMVEKALNIKPNRLNYTDLMKIPGIGVVKANQLIKENVRKLTDLNKHLNILPLQSKLYLKLKPTAAKHANIKLIESVLQLQNSTFVGSYRRGKPVSNDIDIVSMLLANDILDKFKQFGKCYIYAFGHCKVSFYYDASKIIKHRAIYKIDIFLANSNNYTSIILYATGSKDFNVMIRQRAKELGYLLNQNGLFKEKKQILLTTEREYFDKLQITYKPPDKR